MQYKFQFEMRFKYLGLSVNFFEIKIQRKMIIGLNIESSRNEWNIIFVEFFLIKIKIIVCLIFICYVNQILFFDKNYVIDNDILGIFFINC